MAVTSDSANATSATSTLGSFSYSHTLGGGSDRLVVVAVAINGSAGVLSVTYDGAAMIKIREPVASSLRVAMFYLLDAALPVAGTYTVAVTFTGTPTGTGNSSGAVMLNGAFQAAPENDAETINAFPAGGLTGNITTFTNSAMVVSCLGTNDTADSVTTQTPDAPAAEETDWNTATINGGISTKIQSIAGATTMGWTWSAGSIPSAMIMISVAPSGSPPTPGLKDIRVKAMSFTGPSSPGSFSIDRVGFQPKACWIFAVKATVEDTVTVDSAQMNGYCDTALNQRVVACGAEDGAQNTWRDRDTSNVILFRTSDGSTVDAAAAVTSYDVDGVTFNFSVLGAAAQGVIYNIVLFGGDDLQAEIASYAINSSPLTGLGFQPEFVLTHGHNDTGGLGQFGMLSIGVFNDNLDEFHNVIFQGNDASDQTTKEALLRGAAFSGQLFAGSMTWESSVSAITSDGYAWTGTNTDVIDTLNFDLSGIDTFVGTFAKVTGAAPATQSLPDLGFEPSLYCLSTTDRVGNTPIGVSSPGATCSIGVYDRSTQTSIYRTDVNNATNSDMRQRSDRVLGTGVSNASYDTLGLAEPIHPVGLQIPTVELDPNDTGAAILIGVWAWELQRKPDDNYQGQTF